MKTLLKELLLGSMLIGLFAGCGPATYMGKVDVVGVGAGAQPANTNTQYVDQAAYKSAKVVYTPAITAKEQDVSDNVKYIAGDALIKEFSGEPKMMVDYLNSKQSFNNLVLIVDKNGVVAWQGYVKTTDFTKALGVSDYGITGPERISLDEAMQRFVGDMDEAEEYDEDKKLEFPKGNADKFLSGFSNATKYPFLFTKLSDMKFTAADGTIVNLSDYTNNGKPTVLVFYMSKSDDSPSLAKDVSSAAGVMGMFGGGMGANNSMHLTPSALLKAIEDTYFRE